jgi:GAF domain-containing protein
MPNPTPGQVAYAAYCETRDPWWHPDFAHLPPEAQQCWEAAAQAVLEAQEKEEKPHE